MALQTVTIKVRKEVAELVEEMVRLGITRIRNHAYNMLIEAGLPKIIEVVERKNRVKKLEMM